MTSDFEYPGVEVPLCDLKGFDDSELVVKVVVAYRGPTGGQFDG